MAPIVHVFLHCGCRNGCVTPSFLVKGFRCCTRPPPFSAAEEAPVEQPEEAKERREPSIVASMPGLRIVDAFKKKPAAPAPVSIKDCRCLQKSQQLQHQFADRPIHGSKQEAVGSGAFVIAPGPSQEHKPCSCGEGLNCYAKISPGENFATFLNGEFGEIFPAKFSPVKLPPPPCNPPYKITRTRMTYHLSVCACCVGPSWPIGRLGP